MSAKKDNAAIVGVGVAACAVCCVGPILGVLTAIGLGTAAGAALFGSLALVLGAGAVVYVVTRRRRRAATCALPNEGPVPVGLTRPRNHP